MENRKEGSKDRKPRAPRRYSAFTANLLFVTMCSFALSQSVVKQASSISPHLTEPVDKTPGLFASGSESSGWLPFELFNGTRLFIPATINGIPVQVMLDSGASSTVVDQIFANKIGLTPERATIGEGEGGSDAVSALNGVNLKLGTLTLSGQTMVATDLGPIQRRLSHPLPVILGNEIFQNAVVDIDFAQRRICFRNPATFVVPSDSIVEKTETEDGIHVVRAIVEGRSARLAFDLGNGSPLVLYYHFWSQAGLLADRPTSTTLIGGFGGFSPQKIAMVHSVALGDVMFTAVPATFPDMKSSAARSQKLDGNLGMPILSRFHLIADFPHDRVLLTPPADTVKPFEVNHSGLTLEPTPAGAKVLYVAPQSPGSKAGLNVNDIVVSVNGNSLTGKTKSSGIQASWRFGTPGETCLLVLTDGQVKKLILGEYF